MLQIETEKDRVVIVFPSRGQDLCLTPDSARKFVEGVRHAASFCEAWVNGGGSRELIRGEQRGAHVRSWDGKVNVRFASITDRESVPYEAARLLADQVESKIVEAECRTTILWTPTGFSETLA